MSKEVGGRKQMRVAVDTSLGVEFVDLTYTGRGVLVEERIKEAAAKHLRLPVEEVYEIVRIDRDVPGPLYG